MDLPRLDGFLIGCDSIARPNTVTPTLCYDNADRLTSISHALLGAPLENIAYTVNDVGIRTQMVDSAGTTTWGYDALYRLTSASYPNGDAISYGYDAVGNRASVTTNGVTTTNVNLRLKMHRSSSAKVHRVVMAKLHHSLTGRGGSNSELRRCGRDALLSTEAIAGARDGEHDGPIGQPIQPGAGQQGIAEELGPFSRRSVAGQDDASSLIAF